MVTKILPVVLNCSQNKVKTKATSSSCLLYFCADDDDDDDDGLLSAHSCHLS
jgi:hypothetical protein